MSVLNLFYLPEFLNQLLNRFFGRTKKQVFSARGRYGKFYPKKLIQIERVELSTENEYRKKNYPN